MKLLLLLLLAFAPVAIVAQTPKNEPPSYMPPKGFVPDEATAIRVAEAILIPIYGQEQIDNEKPLRATLEKGVWTVGGSLKEGYAGGVAVVKLRQKDACVLYVMHGK